MDYLNWTLSSQKLFKLQRKIQETETKNPRLCRNFQRLFYRTSVLQLLIIHKILQIQFKRSMGQKEKIAAYQRCWGAVPEPIFQETTIQEKIIFPKLISKEYRFFLTRQIMNILWVLALSPILENKKNDQVILTGLKSSQIYKIIGTFFKKPFIQYIIISQFSNFFNKKNKLWILSNLLMEKKFFFHWLKSEKANLLSNTVQPWQFKYMSYEKRSDVGFLGEELPKDHRKIPTLSLKTTFENFTTLNFINSYIPQVLKFNKQIQKSLSQLDRSLNNGNKIGVQKFWNETLNWASGTNKSGTPHGRLQSKRGRSALLAAGPDCAPRRRSSGRRRSSSFGESRALGGLGGASTRDAADRLANSLNRKKFGIKTFSLARPEPPALGESQAGLTLEQGVPIERNQQHFLGTLVPHRYLNFRKSLFVKFNEIYRQRALLMDLRLASLRDDNVSLNIVLPILDNFFFTDKIIQLKKFPTRLQKKHRRTRYFRRDGPRFCPLAHRMFQFFKIKCPMRLTSIGKPKGTSDLSQLLRLWRSLDLRQFDQLIECRQRPDSNSLIIDIMRSFNEKYFYKKFHQFLLTFKFTNYYYFIKLGLKQHSFFEIYRRTGPSGPGGACSPFGESRALGGRLRLAAPRPPGPSGTTLPPISIKKVLFEFQFSNNCPPIYGSKHPLGQFAEGDLPNYWMEYFGFLLLPLTTKKNYQVIHKFFENYAQIHGLHLKFIKLFSLSQGIHFLGWFFQKKVYHFTGSISRANIQNHQKELKFYLKTPANKNKPIDHVISELNQRILYWQKFYNSIKLSNGKAARMNDYLFWLIWYWLKKRHRTRSSKWLYNRYWKKSTYRKWLFSDNNYTLIFYNL